MIAQNNKTNSISEDLGLFLSFSKLKNKLESGNADGFHEERKASDPDFFGKILEKAITSSDIKVEVLGLKVNASKTSSNYTGILS